LHTGNIVGSGYGRDSAYATQQNHDNAYIQCMYGQGHKEPVSDRIAKSPTPIPTNRFKPPHRPDRLLHRLRPDPVEGHGNLGFAQLGPNVMPVVNRPGLLREHQSEVFLD